MDKTGLPMGKIGLYVHWPYCTRICPYCDFNIYKNKPDTEDALIAVILTDMRTWRDMSGPRKLTSIHFGGGTPSLMQAENLRSIIELAQALWSPAADLEIGLEANPNNISTPVLEGWRDAGIERVSVGVQSFENNVLKFLGRDHDGAQARSALERAVGIIPRVSADLIYGWTGQTLVDWRTNLETAIQTGVTHISAYQLTIEQGTAFERAERRGDARAVDGDRSADLYELGVDILGRAGFTQYEVSNFAKTEADRSRHNSLYWQGGDYVGVGPGAHGRLSIEGKRQETTRQATICALKPQGYIECVDETGHGISSRETLSGEAWAQEYVLMGLRVCEGISLSRYETIAGQSLSADIIAAYVQAGLLLHDQDNLSATPAGRLVLDRLSHELLLG